MVDWEAVGAAVGDADGEPEVEPVASALDAGAPDAV